MLVFHGFMAEEDLETVRNALSRRNQIAHGRLKRPVPSKLLRTLVQLTDRLLEQREVELAEAP
jgi:hypothetical protein